MITPWIKASLSDSSGSCVQLRRNEDRVEMRDSKHPDGAVLDDFTREELAAFLDGVKHGEFDHLLD